MNNKQVNKSKEAVRAELQQPLKTQRAATQTTQGKSTQRDADYQQKRRMAAERLLELDKAHYEVTWDLPVDMSCIPTFYHLFHFRVYCTPRDLFFRLNEEWVKVTVGDLVKLLPDDGEEYRDMENGKEFHAGRIIKTLKSFCKDHGKISWTLPKLERGSH